MPGSTKVKGKVQKFCIETVPERNTLTFVMFSEQKSSLKSRMIKINLSKERKKRFYFIIVTSEKKRSITF